MYTQSDLKSSLSFREGVTSDSLPDKGVIFARIQIREGHFINIFHTHLQASYVVEEAERGLPNFYVRIKQFVMMKNFVAEKMAMYGQNGELSLLVGDFNIDANLKQYPSAHVEKLLGRANFFATNKLVNEYDLFMNVYNNPSLPFTLTDLFYITKKYHPITYGDAAMSEYYESEIPAETMLTGKEDHLTKQCLDYIFLIESKSPMVRPNLFVNTNSLKVEKFNENIPNVSQLSDHYGLSCVICSSDYLNKNYKLAHEGQYFFNV